jgi:hypothetical protein
MAMTKFQWLVLGCLSGGCLLGLPVAANAQCVVADVSIQAAIDGSEAPAEQVNDVAVEASDQCQGNTSVHVNRQVHVGGTGNVRQVRQSRHRIESHSTPNQRRRQGPTVVIPVEVQADVDNPADRLEW